jgi:hypothetical protein
MPIVSVAFIHFWPGSLIAYIIGEACIDARRIGQTDENIDDYIT